MHSKTVNIIFIIILVAWTGALIILGINDDIPVGTDSTLFLLLGKSFAQGTGYLDIAKPGVNNTILVPSAFPMLLSLYWLLFEPHIIIIKIILFLLLLVGLCACYGWLSSLIGRLAALLMAMAFGSTWMFVFIGNEILSESFFIPVLYGSLFLGYSRLPRLGSQGPLWMSLVLMVLLARIRVVGVPFLCVALILFLYKRDYKKFIAGILLFGSLLLLENHWTVPDSHTMTYTREILKVYPVITKPVTVIVELGKIYANNIWSFAGSMYATILFPWFYSLHTMTVIKRLIVLAIFVIGFYGVVFCWKKNAKQRPMILAMAISWIPVFAWSPTGTIFRYLAPFFPFLLLCFIYPIWYHTEKSTNKIIKAIPFIILLLVIANQVIVPWKNKQAEQEINAFRELNKEIGSISNKPAALISPWYRYSFMKTGIPSCSFKKNETHEIEPCLGCEKLWAILKLSDKGSPIIGENALEKFSVQYPALLINYPWGLYLIRKL